MVAGTGTPPRSAIPEAPATAAPRTAALRTSGLAKAFGPTQALRDCSFELLAGEVHCIVGENGSGKSTFVKILSGIQRPDTGMIELSGEAVTAIRSPRDAMRAGIVTVFQEVLVVEARSVLENVWMGSDGVFRAQVDPRREAQAGARGARVATRARAAARSADREPLAERAPGLLSCACVGPRFPDPDPRRGHIRARRFHPATALCRHTRACRGRRRDDLHLASHGRDRRDRRSLHRHAVR